MAVTLEQISKWLDERDFNHKLDSENEKIVSASSGDGSRLAHFIRANEDGELFNWTAQLVDDNMDFIDIKDHQYAGKIISHMLYLNYSTKFGTWEFDPSDGDIRLSIEIPLEDAVMTGKQFNRIFGYMTSDSHDGANEIMQIMKTGEIPEDDSEAEMIAKLEAMLAQLKSGDSSSTDSTDGI